MNQPIHSLIVGPGAIGSLLCAHIQPYSKVWVYPHKPNITLAQHIISKTPIALTWEILANRQQHIDLIWVCSKANHSEAVATKLLTQWPQAIAILLHNGLGPQQALNDRFPGRVIYGMTTNAAFRDQQGYFNQTAFGNTYFGNPNHSRPELDPWLSLITAWPGILSFSLENDIVTTLWKKLAINAVVNPLTAFYQIKNGELLDAHYQHSIESLCEEISLIAASDHIKLPSPLAPTVIDVIQLTAQNYSSMNRDITYNRTTELDFILGFLRHRAQFHSINTPHIDNWYQQILALQPKCHEE